MSHPLRLIGHRGASAERPENTLSSFQRAQAIGVDVLETDVHVSADGVVVISHDPDGLATAGIDKQIRHTDLAELKTWDVGRTFKNADGEACFAGRGLTMPTLEELLLRFPEAHFNIDIKPADVRAVDAVLAVLTAQGATDRVTLASFHTRVIRRVRAQFDGPTVLAKSEVVQLIAVPSALLRRMNLGGSVVQVPTRSGPFDLSTAHFIDKCHDLGMRVDYWTINDVDTATTLLDRGADGLITDAPAALKPLFESRR